MTTCLNKSYHVTMPGWGPKESQTTASLRPKSQRHKNSVRVAVLLVVIAILNMLDLHFTLFAHHVGVLKELNPIAASILRMDVDTSLISFKLLTLLMGSVLLWKARQSPWAPSACWLLVLVYTGLAITWISWMHTYLSVQSLAASLALPINPAHPVMAGY